MLEQNHSTKDGPYLMQKVFMLGSEYRHDMNVMHEQLDAVTAENVLIDPLAEKGEEKQHCFVAAERVDSTAKEAFDRVIDFIDNKTK